jgi:hypothetical protein
MSTPYTFSGTLVYPPDDGQPAVARPFSVSGQYDVKAEFDYDLLGGGTQVVDFGSVSDAKAIQIEVAADAQAPVNVRFNGGTDDVEISAGGFLCAANPAPSTGVSALSLVHTNDAKVQVRILG